MIGVAITTHNRPGLLRHALTEWRARMPSDGLLVVVDDASTTHPPPSATYRFPQNVGIAQAKNKCLELLMQGEVTDLFLADDDVWPVRYDWWVPYVEDPEPHLMLCWGRKRRLDDDGHYTRWTHPRGVLLYAERRVIDRVGGMRPEFGRWGGEHVEWSRRIYHAGLTSHRYMDLHGSTAWWHAEDWGRPGETNAALGRRRARISTIDAAAREASAPLRYALYEKFRGSSDFVEYRT